MHIFDYWIVVVLRPSDTHDRGENNMIRIFNDIIYVTSSYDHHASINTMIFYTLLTDQFDFIITTASPFHVNDGAALFLCRYLVVPGSLSLERCTKDKEEEIFCSKLIYCNFG